MDADAKPKLLVRRYSASMAGVRVAIAKTALERMEDVTRLSRQLRQLQKLAWNGRGTQPSRAR